MTNTNDRSTFLGAGVIVLLLGLVLFSCTTNPVEPRRMEVLFLGHDSDHHNAKEYLPYLASALTPRGINFSYSPSPSALNEENLKKYDAVAIYANHDSITKDEESALLDFVKEGGGFVPIHSASFCFRNSQKYVELVGGQFISHDTATFSLDIVDSQHPASSGLKSFSTWDETYVHTMHSEKKVLMERVDGEQREPYTWVKDYGDGRVFYTALGHDERTWTQPSFHDLLYKGIIWAIGDEKKAALDQMSFPSLQYSDAKIANYEKRDPAPQLQAPLTPEESMKLIQVPPDFKLELFASEPDIVNPIAMNWDEKGRLWILETVDYPNEIKVEDGIGRDRIKIVEDTDADGKADKFTVFAENLSVPTSIVFSDGGVIVSQAPHFIFLKDTDGDDVADVRENIISGWGTFDTHAGPSNLRYGFDNKIWGVLGYSGFEGNVGGEDHKFSQGIYRFSPDGSDLDYICRTSNNTWGLGFSESFDVFISTANNTHSGYYGIPDSHMKDVDGIHLRGVAKIDGHYLFHPITRNFRQVDVFGGFTAAAGHALYTARNFPKEYWNRIAFVAEPTGHLLHNAILEKDGAGFTESDGWNIMSSSDEWVSPVAAEVGPDGALWVADWYNFIIQHNPTPPGFENGEGNAHINPLRDKQRGRIYRVVYKSAKQPTTTSLDVNDSGQLLAALGDDNLFWRMHAQRLLVQNGDTDIKSSLIEMVNDRNVDDMGMNSKALHALWTLDGLGLTKMNSVEESDPVDASLSHPYYGVRKSAIQILPNDNTTLDKLIESGVLRDRNGPVRLEAINKLWELPPSPELAATILNLGNDPDVLSDLWLSRATYLAAVKHRDDFIVALLRDQPNILQEQQEALLASNINYKAVSTSTVDWKEVQVPKWLNHTGIEELAGFSGIMWYRTTVNLSSVDLSGAISIHMPGASPRDITYINGQQVGSGEGWDTKRKYSIPKQLLKEGSNTIAIQILGGGGIGGDEDFFYLSTGTSKRSLAGQWKYKIEKVVTSGRSEYAEGDNIVDVFLKNYGPYAQKKSKELDDSNMIIDKRFVIKTIPDQMKYDVTELTAGPGEVIELTFINDDAMQHNLLIIEPGSLREVGTAAEAYAKTKTAVLNDYVPENNEIIHVIPILNPGEEYRLRFKAPRLEGDYPYVCTFPGHWQTMNGVLKIRKQ